MESFFRNVSKQKEGFGFVASLFTVEVGIGGVINAGGLKDVEEIRLEPNFILRSSFRRARSTCSEGAC